MTTTLEAPCSNSSMTNGDKAIGIIDTYRHAAGDTFAIESLDYEFYTYASQLDRRGIYLADAAANLAGAFKWRGGIVAASELHTAGYRNLVTASAGNHLRGLIVAAGLLDMSLNGFVPGNAPDQKKQGAKDLARELGVDFTLHVTGDTFDDTLVTSQAFSLKNEMPFVHPYDDPAVIAGQGTLADHILRYKPETQNLVLPTGGGGLIAGVAARLCELDRSDINVFGAQAEGSDSLSRSFGLDIAVEATNPNQRYGGSAVSRVGEYGLSLCNKLLHRENIITVSDEAVDRVIEEYQNDCKEFGINPAVYRPYEPTTVVAVAALQQLLPRLQGDTVVIGTGRNAPLESPLKQWKRSRIAAGLQLR